MLLNEIKEKLQELDENVFYGMVDNSMMETVWNYIVFNRKTLTVNKNRTGYSEYFGVHIVRENFIPEGLATSVIDKMREINGMRLVESDAVYTYIEKPNTNVVVEMISLEFVRPVKG